MTYDFDAMRQTLDGAAHITGGTKADRDVARIHALATVALAESVAQLVAQNGPGKYFGPTHKHVVGDVVDIYESAAEWRVDAVSDQDGDQRLEVTDHAGRSAHTLASRVEFIRHDELKPERAPDPVERDWAMGDVVTMPGSMHKIEYHVESVGIDQGGTFLKIIAEDGTESKVWAEHARFIRHDSAEALDADFAEAANAGRKSDAFAAAKAKTKKAGK